MAIPQLSPEERQAALEKAKAARIKRAEVRDDLKSGKLTLEKVLDMKEDPIVGLSLIHIGNGSENPT